MIRECALVQNLDINVCVCVCVLPALLTMIDRRQQVALAKMKSRVAVGAFRPTSPLSHPPDSVPKYLPR